MKLFNLYQTAVSLAFVLLIAHTEAYQTANWPEGRVVHVHPWVLFLAYALGIFALIMWLAKPRDPAIGPLLDRWLPIAASLLLFGGVVGMALFAPGPYPR